MGYLLVVIVLLSWEGIQSAVAHDEDGYSVVGHSGQLLPADEEEEERATFSDAEESEDDDEDEPEPEEEEEEEEEDE